MRNATDGTASGTSMSFCRRQILSQNYEFYNTRAKEAAAEAAKATLDNVRERALRSETAWREMADRALQMEQEREVAKEEREKRQAEAAELAAAQTTSQPEAVAG